MPGTVLSTGDTMVSSQIRGPSSYGKRTHTNTHTHTHTHTNKHRIVGVTGEEAGGGDIELQEPVRRFT